MDFKILSFENVKKKNKNTTKKTSKKSFSVFFSASWGRSSGYLHRDTIGASKRPVMSQRASFQPFSTQQLQLDGQAKGGPPSLTEVSTLLRLSPPNFLHTKGQMSYGQETIGHGRCLVRRLHFPCNCFQGRKKENITIK